MGRQIFTLTTDAGGAATVGAGTTSAQSAVMGELSCIKYIPGTLDTGATIVVTCENNGVSKPLLTKASAGTSNTWFYPRDLMHKVEDGAALTGTAGGDRTEPIVDGQFKIVVSSGGNVATGSIVIYYED